MIDERIEELVNADIDGRLPEGSRAELNRHLLANPEVRALHRDLQRLQQALEPVRPEPVPADLVTGIMDRIPARAVRPGALSTARSWRYAFALAASLAVAAVALRLGSLDEDVDGAAAVGTMAAGEQANSAATIDRPGLSASVRLRQAGASLLVDLDVASQSSVDVVASYGGHTVGLSARGDMAGQRQTLELPADGAGPVVVRFASQGRVIEEISLQAPGQP
jgi:anti-sigma factor RsiW